MMLFTDVSVEVKSGAGFGAYVAVSDIDESLDEIVDRIRVKRFDATSSTRLELQTLLWALGEIRLPEVEVYTDSQNIPSLLKRREKLEKNDYYTKSGKLHRHWELYRDFFAWVDSIDIRVVKVTGHSPKKTKTKIDKIFSLVDKASRNALRSNS